MVLKNNPLYAPILISLSPLVNLKEHFISIMDSAQASIEAQDAFFSSFKNRFNLSIDSLDLEELAHLNSDTAHLLTYGMNDKISPAIYTQEFLSKHPEIVSRQYEDISHERMHRDPRVLEEINSFI